MKNTVSKQAEINRGLDGKFRKGNTLGNRWQKGVSGNPKGRPRDRILPHLKEIAEQAYPDQSGHTYAEMAARALFEAGISGDIHALRELLDRLDGRMRVGMDVTTETVDREKQREDALQLFADYVAALHGDETAAREMMAEDAPTLIKYVN
jgi:hypothetical protein